MVNTVIIYANNLLFDYAHCQFIGYTILVTVCTRKQICIYIYIEYALFCGPGVF